MIEVELRDWEHFKEYITENFSGQTGYIFRGHADRAWKLESTLTRLSQRVSRNISGALLEQMQLKNFRMNIRGLRGANAPSLSEDEVWALGQHHGLCTPFLDWTFSPYIAAYFAFENVNACSNEWRSVFALNKTRIIEQGNQLLQLIEPLQNDNNRIIAQAGLFSRVPTGTDLETWLIGNGLSDCLTKIHIEDICRIDVINDLMLMNISGKSVYPDLHGASLGSNMLIEIMSENHEITKGAEDLLHLCEE